MEKFLILRSSVIITILTAVLLFAGCAEKNPVEPEPEKGNPVLSYSFFPGFFHEIGSDADSSYFSLRGTNDSDSLELEAVFWCVIEMGPFLGQNNLPREVLFYRTSMCGTVFQRTWVKQAFTKWLSAAEIDTLNFISFTNWHDTVTVPKIILCSY
jgi:hypothetical protein